MWQTSSWHIIIIIIIVQTADWSIVIMHFLNTIERIWKSPSCRSSLASRCQLELGTQPLVSRGHNISGDLLLLMDGWTDRQM